MSHRNIPAKLKRRVLVEAGHRCAIPACRQIEVQIHHIVPWSKCQEHKYENLIALCANCHSRADKNEIDRKSLKIYKSNLRLAHDKFSQFEMDVLFYLNSLPEGHSLKYASIMLPLIHRIGEIGYVDFTEPKGSVLVMGMEIKPVELFLTDNGREFIDSLELSQDNNGN